jgi:hypothetical protein
VTGPISTLSAVVAHGIGDRQDLPLPFGYVLAGAGLALVVSFVALGALWRSPRLGRPDAGWLLPSAAQRFLRAPGLRVALRLLGLLATAYVGVAAFLGSDDALNPTAGVVYVLLWVGVPLVSVLVGPFWRAVNPLRTIHGGLAWLLRTRARQGIVPLPAWVGYWPTAAGLFAFLWLELIAADRGTLPVLRTWFLTYAGLHLIAASVFGSRWFDKGDAFEAFSDLFGRLSPIGRREDGRWVLRSPLDGLAGLRPAPGLVITVAILLAGTAYDSVTGAPAWRGFIQASAHQDRCPRRHWSRPARRSRRSSSPGLCSQVDAATTGAPPLGGACPESSRTPSFPLHWGTSWGTTTRCWSSSVSRRRSDSRTRSARGPTGSARPSAAWTSASSRPRSSPICRWPRSSRGT